MNLSNWEPMPPKEGPPLPLILDPYLPFHGDWPWYKVPISTFTVAASVSGSGGTVSPATQTVKSGSNASISISPASGYNISGITDNGTAVTIANPYVINNVTANHNVVVTFVAISAGGPCSFTIKGINLPSGAASWGAVCEDQTGNYYQRAGCTIASCPLSQQSDIESFQTPTSELTINVVVMAANPEAAGAGVALNALVIYTVSITVQNGGTYTFDLTQGIFI